MTHRELHFVEDASSFGKDGITAIAAGQAEFALTQLFEKKTQLFDQISGGKISVSSEDQKLEILSSIFGSLKEGGKVDLQLDPTSWLAPNLLSMVKMVGFQNAEVTIEQSGISVKANKAMMSQGPAKIKRKQKPAEENPWANLDNNDSNLINEDELMKDANAIPAAKKFTGDKDVMQRAKPCANCTCGLKE